MLRNEGATVLATAQDRHGRDTGMPIVMEKQIGRGHAIVIAIDITGTVVRLQQGIDVTRDGLGKPITELIG